MRWPSSNIRRLIVTITRDRFRAAIEGFVIGLLIGLIAVYSADGELGYALPTFLIAGFVLGLRHVGQAGNGTAMQTAAIGPYFLRDPERRPATMADVSRIAHQNPRGVAGGIAIAEAAQWPANDGDWDEISSCDSNAEAIRPHEATFAELIRGLPARLDEDRETGRHAIARAGSSKPETVIVRLR